MPAGECLDKQVSIIVIALSLPGDTYWKVLEKRGTSNPSIQLCSCISPIKRKKKQIGCDKQICPYYIAVASPGCFFLPAHSQFFCLAATMPGEFQFVFHRLPQNIFLSIVCPCWESWTAVACISALVQNLMTDKWELRKDHIAVYLFRTPLR